MRWPRVLRTFRPRNGERSDQRRASLDEQLAQKRTMAVSFVCAIAADGEMGGVRERSKRIEEVTRLPLVHLGSVAARECVPGARGSARQRCLHQLLTGREVRKPYVVPIACSELGPRDASWRAANRAEANTLAWRTWGTELHDPDGHKNLAGRTFASRPRDLTGLDALATRYRAVLVGPK